MIESTKRTDLFI